jgi:hypothetical protein
METLSVEPLSAAVDLLMKRAVPTLRFSIRKPRFPQAGLSLLWTVSNRLSANIWRRSPARLRWCDQIPTPAENQLHPYSEHSCAHRHSHGFGKLFGD